MAFYPVEIDACPAYGWQGGPSVVVDIKPLKNRHERRNAPVDLVQHRYILPFQNIPDDDYLEYIKSAWMAMFGPKHSFLVKDWKDNTATNEPFGIGDGVTSIFQLKRVYTFGMASYEREITKPLAGHQVFANGVLSGESADVLTGLVDFGSSPPGVGEVLTWSGPFRIPVRFDSFYLPATIDNRLGDGRFAVNGSCELVEVFGE